MSMTAHSEGKRVRRRSLRSTHCRAGPRGRRGGAPLAPIPPTHPSARDAHPLPASQPAFAIPDHRDSSRRGRGAAGSQALGPATQMAGPGTQSGYSPSSQGSFPEFASQPGGPYSSQGYGELQSPGYGGFATQAGAGSMQQVMRAPCGLLVLPKPAAPGSRLLALGCSMQTAVGAQVGAQVLAGALLEGLPTVMQGWCMQEGLGAATQFTYDFGSQSLFSQAPDSGASQPSHN